MTQRSKIKSFCFMAILGLILGVMAVFCVACNKESVTGITVTGLPENNVAVITDTDNTLQLGYDILGGKGNVEWSSGDNDVASVDASGKVVLIDSGAVVITATLKSNEKIKAEVLLTIKDERTITDTITLSGMPDTNTVQYGDEPLQLSATCSNVQATLVWTSSDMTVATVNDSGLVSFVGGGSTEITVYKKGQRAVKASATLTVIRNVESVTICDIDGGTVVVGYDYRLNEVYEYALQTEYSPWNASAFELEWSVDDTNIATIDENGILTGKQSGRVTVTAQVKDSEVKATKEFDVVALNDRSEDFSYAVANRCIVGSVCADAWVDYTGTKVTSQNTDLFIETYDTNKRMLRVEKNTDWVHWSHICLGSWNLVPGKYILTLDMEVINGTFEGKINGAQYNSTPAEYEHGIRPDAIGELAFGALSQFKAENGQYVIEFELTKSYENFGIMLYDSVSQDPYALNIKSFSLSVADFAVDTDIYSDGILILGEEYKFVPAAIADGMTFNYKFTGNENGIVELKDGKLIPKKVGNNVKLTVSTDYNGNKLTKEFNLSVIANPFNENEDDYSYAVDVTNRGNLVYDVMRTSVYLRTHNWIMSIEDYNNGKTLKLKKDYAPAWDGSVQFMLGKVKKGTYKVTFTLHGDDVASTDKFNGYIYPITLKEGWQTTFTKDGAYIRGNAPYGSIHDSNCVKNGNSYTYTITVAEDTENFGIELCGGTTVDYTLYLDAFKFEGLSDIDEAQITSPLNGANIKSGEVTNLTANVTYEGGASVGQVYETEWSVAPATNNGGSARIVDGENGTKQLQGLKPGNVILTFTVTSATGKVIKQTVELTIELGELAIDTDMYSDGILVKGKEYKFEPILLIDGMTFEYSYKAQDGTTDAPDIVEVVDGKLIAKSAGTVKLIVSSSIDGAPISKTIEITVKEYGGWEDANYADATKVKELGSNVYSIERTNVYLRTYNMKIAKDGNSLALSKDYLPHGWSEVVLNLGHVEKGTYAVSFELTGTDFVSAKFSGHVKTVTWVHGYESIFTTGAYTDGDILDKTVYQGAVNGNVYTLYVTVTEAQDNFGIALCSNTTVAYTVNLNSFKFEKLPTVTDVEIQTDLKTTIKTGEQANLNVSVTYEGGASKGQEYTAEWKTSGEGKVRIAEDGTLTAVAPGSVTIELNVVCADGKTFQKTLTVTVEVGEISIETDMYDDGLLVKGAEYSFVPEKFTDESVFEYSYSADGIVKVENSKLTALKTGDVTVTVTETVTGAKKEISIKVKEYGGWEDANYADATNAKNRVESGTCIYDVARTNVYLRTFNLSVTVEDYNDGKTLKLAQDFQAPWAGSALFMLGDVKKGTYEVSFTLHGSDIGNWNKFQGYIYPITWSENYKTTFSAEAYSRRGTTPYGNIFDEKCVHVGNTYTYTITITEDISNFGIELCGGEPMGYTFYLDAFKFEKLPVVTGAEMNVILTDNKMQTGDKVDLAETVTYAEGATKGENYIAEWSVENGTGTARIESGKLVAVSAGNVTLKLHVVSASGAEFDKSLNITIELGEVIVEHDMYEDGILVKDKEYKFEPQKFSDDSVFEYSYSVENIVKVENGKLIAIGVGNVTLTVTETVTSATKVFELQVVDFSGTKDDDYSYAINPTQHGDFFDIERTGVYLRTFNMRIEKTEDNKLTLTKNYVPAGGASVLFYLGNVEAGRYCITVNLGGDLAWNQFKGFLYPLNMKSGWQTTFGDGAYTKGSEPYGNIHTAGFCLYSGESSTAGGTYKMFIDVTSAQTDFGLMLETWETENTSFAITLGSFSFERQELSKTPNFNNASVYKHGEGITVTGSNGSMAVTKVATEASVTETGALRVVMATTWSEIALCFGKVQAGTYTLTLDISAVDMSGAYWFTGLVYYGTCKNGNISYNGETGLLSGNAAEVTHAATAKTVSLNITLAEDIENFAIILASNGDCGQAVNVALSNISLVGNTEA